MLANIRSSLGLILYPIRHGGTPYVEKVLWLCEVLFPLKNIFRFPIKI